MAVAGDIGSCDEVELVLMPLSVRFCGFSAVASRPMSSMLRGRG